MIDFCKVYRVIKTIQPDICGISWSSGKFYIVTKAHDRISSSEFGKGSLTRCIMDALEEFISKNKDRNTISVFYWDTVQVQLGGHNET